MFSPKVYILVLAGTERDAIASASARYPGREIIVVSKAELRESEWNGKLRKLRSLTGEAFLIYADSLESLPELMLLKWTVFVHRCHETVLVDFSGRQEIATRGTLFTLLPQTLFALSADLVAFAFTWIVLKIFQVWLWLTPEVERCTGLLDLAYLYPSPGGLDVPGGAATHVSGFLSGLKKEDAQFAVVSGQAIGTGEEVFHVRVSRGRHLFREAAALSYNLRFALTARHLLLAIRPSLLYQRHGRFLFAGAILSRWLGIPLVLEYNGSEDWIARHWDPTRFPRWLRMCEKISIRAAALITVVSNPLKAELMKAGVPANRILVNPNAVDPEVFQPGQGGAALRAELGFQPADIVVGFVGTFSYWHGVDVLREAVRSLLVNGQPESALRFLLVGDGLLAPQLRNALGPQVREGSVVFTGSVPHRSIRTYLDAADIVVSPHIPMPGDIPFFGSPTKLFEYMAMSKAIAASALDQIAEVLEQDRTALLVRPGDPGELATAIQRLASDAELRTRLGLSARAQVVAHHTWRQNARRVLEHFAPDRSRNELAEFAGVAAPPAPGGNSAISLSGE